MEIQIFKNDRFGEVRTMVINGEPWFVGKDVAEVLGYTDTRKAIRMHVDDDDKGGDILSTPGGRQQITIINESGLYALILSSKLPQAKDFKRWVASEVLGRSQTAKAIREHVDEIDKGGSIITTPL